jgi:hypothetical protein
LSKFAKTEKSSASHDPRLVGGRWVEADDLEAIFL